MNFLVRSAFLPLLVFAFLAFFSTNVSFAQRLTEEDKAALSAYEDTLVQLADSMLRMPIPDDRLEYGFEFARVLKDALSMDAAAQYPFSRLDQVINILSSDDKRFRIFNWLVAPSENIRRYYGVIQMSDGTLYLLINQSNRLDSNALVTPLDSKHWYGCEYYRIKEMSVGREKYYFLFGLNRDGSYSNKKLVDVLSFTEDGPIFGAPLFVVPNESETRLQTQHRVIWEYKKTALFSLNFDEGRNMIMFDRLRSEINNPARKNTYIPTGQTDGMRWERNKWVFVKEAIPILKLKEGEAPIDGVMQRR